MHVSYSQKLQPNRLIGELRCVRYRKRGCETFFTKGLRKLSARYCICRMWINSANFVRANFSPWMRHWSTSGWKPEVQRQTKRKGLYLLERSWLVCFWIMGKLCIWGTIGSVIPLILLIGTLKVPSLRTPEEICFRKALRAQCKSWDGPRWIF